MWSYPTEALKPPGACLQNAMKVPAAMVEGGVGYPSPETNGEFPPHEFPTNSVGFLMETPIGFVVLLFQGVPLFSGVNLGC